jgi:hypothetical protein
MPGIPTSQENAGFGGGEVDGGNFRSSHWGMTCATTISSTFTLKLHTRSHTNFMSRAIPMHPARPETFWARNRLALQGGLDIASRPRHNVKKLC